MREFTYTIQNEFGIHASAAGMLAKCAESCSSHIFVSKGEKTTEATRLITIMAMAIRQGETIKITVKGEEEKKDYITICKFFNENNL